MHGVELAVCVERQRMCGQHRAVGDQAPHPELDLAVVHRRFSLTIFRAGDGKLKTRRVSVVARPKRMR